MRIILAGLKKPENKDEAVRLTGEFTRNARVVEDRGAAMCVVETDGFAEGVQSLSALNGRLKPVGWIAEEPRPRFPA